MDPVTLVVTALSAGALKGTAEAASTTVTASYAGLKQLVRSRLAGKPSAELILAEHEADPETFEVPVTKLLRDSGLAQDEAAIAAATRLLEVLDTPGAQAGKYVVDVRNSPGTVIGDHTHVTQTFHTRQGP
jgi:hypothetical protein